MEYLKWLENLSSSQPGQQELQYHQNNQVFFSEANSIFLVLPLMWTGDAVGVAQPDTAGIVALVWVRQFY